MARIEIIAIGRELLKGQVLDTNSHWLAQQLASLGGQVKRMVAVDDDVEQISQELRRAMDQGTRFIFTLGGMGPTFDDQTLAGVARATGRSLVLDPRALEFVRGRYGHFQQQGYVDSAEMTPEREKMAWLPEGALMLPNPVGAAPGVWLELVSCHIISLPGVPREMKAIFEQEVLGRLRQLLGTHCYLERVVRTPLKDESQLTRILGELRERFPQVYFKSKPRYFGRDVELEVCLTASGQERSEVERWLKEAEEEIHKRTAG